MARQPGGSNAAEFLVGCESRYVRRRCYRRSETWRRHYSVGTGFGSTNPATPVGTVVPSDKTYTTSTAPTVTINNIPAKVFGAALAPGFAGLYQVAIQVPASLADGDWPIVATIGGVQSPTGVVLSVHQ